MAPHIVRRETTLWLSDAWIARDREYRLRGGPLFLSQLVVLGLHMWWQGSWALPVPPLRGSIAIPIAAIGLGARLWGTGILSSSTMVSMTPIADRLVTWGVFGLVRNPLYLGDILILTSYTLLLNPWLAPPFALYHIVRSMRLIAYEERVLRARWGAAYAEYCRHVPRLVPRFVRVERGPVNWWDSIKGSTIWIGFVTGYVATLLTGDLWTGLTPFELAGLFYFFYYFSRKTHRAEVAPQLN